MGSIPIVDNRIKESFMEEVVRIFMGQFVGWTTLLIFYGMTTSEERWFSFLGTLGLVIFLSMIFYHLAP